MDPRMNRVMPGLSRPKLKSAMRPAFAPSSGRHCEL